MKSKCGLIAIWLMISFNSFIETGEIDPIGIILMARLASTIRAREKYRDIYISR